MRKCRAVRKKWKERIKWWKEEGRFRGKRRREERKREKWRTARKRKNRERVEKWRGRINGGEKGQGGGNETLKYSKAEVEECAKEVGGKN